MNSYLEMVTVLFCRHVPMLCMYGLAGESSDTLGYETFINRFDETVRLLQAFHLTAVNDRFPAKRYHMFAHTYLSACARYWV